MHSTETPFIEEYESNTDVLEKWGSLFADVAQKIQKAELPISVVDVGTGPMGAGRWGLEYGLYKEFQRGQVELFLSDLPDVKIRRPRRGTRIIRDDELLNGTIHPTWINASYISCCNAETEMQTYARLRSSPASILTIAEYILKDATREELFRLLSLPLEREERQQWNDDERFLRQHSKHTRDSLLSSVQDAGWKVVDEVLVMRGRLFVVAHDPDKPIGRQILEK